jgi:predicted alpha/beta hydrolase family esterase
MYSLVFVAGYLNSEPEHWQRIWYKQMQNTYFVEQDNWKYPNKEAWIERLDETLKQIDGDIIIVAHSLGCNTVVEWANTNQNSHILSALFVAIPDTQREDFPQNIVGFEHPPMKQLWFPSLAVISENDPYASLERSKEIASIWGSKISLVGKKGHINLASHLGEWKEGKEILKMLTCKAI